MLFFKPVPSRWLARAWRAASRHKIISGAAALALAVLIAAGAGWAAPGSSGGPGRRAQPAAPAFTLPALGHPGKTVALRQYAGHPVVVNFFASWCGPCDKETPLLARFYRSGQAQVAMMGLDENDETGAAERFVRQYGVTFPVGFDPAVRAGRAHGVEAIPQTFLLDASHHIVKHVYGALTLQELRAGTSEITGARQAPAVLSRSGA